MCPPPNGLWSAAHYAWKGDPPACAACGANNYRARLIDSRRDVPVRRLQRKTRERNDKTTMSLPFRRVGRLDNIDRRVIRVVRSG